MRECDPAQLFAGSKSRQKLLFEIHIAAPPDETAPGMELLLNERRNPAGRRHQLSVLASRLLISAEAAKLGGNTESKVAGLRQHAYVFADLPRDIAHIGKLGIGSKYVVGQTSGFG